MGFLDFVDRNIYVLSICFLAALTAWVVSIRILASTMGHDQANRTTKKSSRIGFKRHDDEDG